MRDHALSEHRPFLLASLAAAVSYWFVADDGVAGLALMVWKGVAVLALSAYALRRAGHLGGKAIAFYLLLSAAGTMAVEFSYLFAGIAFAAAQLVATVYFLSNRRKKRSASQTAAAVALLLGVPILAILFTYPQPNWMLASAYTILLAAMAASAWISRFSRYRVGIGAVLYVLSDLILLGEVAERLPQELADWLVWPLYYVGQLMIATGVVQTLRRDHEA